MAVYQEKNKNKWTKDSRSWYFRCYYTDSFGKRKQKVSKLYKTKREAAEYERIFLNKTINNEDINRDIMFKDVYKEWLEIKMKTLKTTTYYALEKKLNKNILEFFKNYKLYNIKYQTIDEWFKYISDTNTTIKYQNNLISYLKKILEFSRDNYKFDSKIISRIHKKKDESIEKENDATWNFWTYDQFKTFINSVDDNLYYVIFNFLYFTGLRIGEMIALTWKDIDLDNKKLSIYKNFTNKLGNRTHKIIPPKTKNSIRTIDLDDKLIELLKEYRKSEEKIINFNDNMNIFGNVSYMCPTTISRHLDKCIEKANIKRITLHGFRHSHVSLLAYLGLDFKDIAERIGDTIEVVENTYYHMFPSKKSKVVNALNKL